MYSTAPFLSAHKIRDNTYTDAQVSGPWTRGIWNDFQKLLETHDVTDAKGDWVLVGHHEHKEIPTVYFAKVAEVTHRPRYEVKVGS